jgi:hypothetical protein
VLVLEHHVDPVRLGLGDQAQERLVGPLEARQQLLQPVA